MEFILATGNPHKVEEINELLKDAPISAIAAPEKVEVVEDGTTFEQNAYKKAMAYYKKFAMPALADDSGLVMPALPDILGIHSARFAPDYPNYMDKIGELLKIIDAKNVKDRSAYFACVLCFVLSEKEVYFFEGRVHGQIGSEIRGSDGFGYDPIFEADGQDGKTLAEIPEWKMENSHRAKAAKEAVNFFKGKNSIAKMT